MSTPGDKRPVFPKEWGWQRYEPAAREQAAQCARRRFGTEYGVLTRNEEIHITQLIYDWDQHQVRAGLLPSIDEREKKGQRYMDIFKALENEARKALDENRLGESGKAHWKLEKERNSQQQRQARSWSRKGRGYGHWR